MINEKNLFDLDVQVTTASGDVDHKLQVFQLVRLAVETQVHSIASVAN